MSKLKRYYLDDYGVLIEHPAGEYVLHSDYAALLAATQWRPIETAPKDGTHVLAFHNGSIWTVWWSDTQMWHDSNDYDYRPTHWMPLPKPPCV